MAEGNPEIDPVLEGRKIASKYLSELRWAKQSKEMLIHQLLTAFEKDAKLHHIDEMEIAADENFGAAVDNLRAEKSKTSHKILAEIARELSKRSDLTFFGKRIVSRLKEELSNENIT